ncbi:hypothetical protein [Geobacillus sp. YF-1]|uniref:hypothetical protein n=1 Tax=Geobacillus sp. YF-1 TaxID=3457480 RepID=UPI0040458934
MFDNSRREVLSFIASMNKREFKFESVEVYIFSPDEIDNAQIGYSIDLRGNSLTGENKGDWKGAWLVIGHDLEVGDPIFVDLSSPNYPVFTAKHGLGYWEAVLLSESLFLFFTGDELTNDIT